MRKRLLQMALAIIAIALPAIPSLAQIPDGYYSSLKGKKGAELKTAVYNIIKNAKVLSYGNGLNSTWWGFYVTDKDESGYCIDRYSPKSSWKKFGSRGSAINGMNIEHSFPKSYWGGDKKQAYEDLFNLMPCEIKINSTKSNYPMGTVVSGDKGNSWTKVGQGSDNKWYWEPADEWKGDFARDYMYMVTCYQDYTWASTTPGSPFQILEQNAYPTLQKWASDLYIMWAKKDIVDKIEIKRNEEVYKIQGNRNPYIDFPELMEYVWGDKVNEAFDPETAVKSSDYNNGGGTNTPDQPEEGTILNVDFTSNKGGATESIVKNESTHSNIWTSSQFGWKASAYESRTKTNYAADAILSLPEIDLTEYKNATLKLTQAVNFAKEYKGLDYLSVEVTYNEPATGNKVTKKLSDFKVPQGNNWTFADFDMDLTPYCGNKVTIGFHYTSDATICCTWEIKDLTITGTKATTGINAPITVSDNHGAIDFSKPYQVYTVDGRQTTLTKGIVIIKQGNATRKIVRY